MHGTKAPLDGESRFASGLIDEYDVDLLLGTT